MATVLLIGAAIKQALTILAATLCIYFGYRLFELTEQKTGDFEASAAWGKVRLSQAAPGIFFTLFGCIVLLAALLTHNSFEAVITPYKREVNVRGTASAGPQTLDWPLCAKSAAYGRNLLQSDPGYRDAASARGAFLREREDGLERVTAYCVDQAIGKNAYARYKRFEDGGSQNGSEEDKRVHEAVASLLSE